MPTSPTSWLGVGVPCDRYIVFLKNKDVDDYDGVEQFVHRSLVQGDIDWFPTNQSKALSEIWGDGEGDDDLDDEGAIEELTREIDENQSIISSVQVNVTALQRELQLISKQQSAILAHIKAGNADAKVEDDANVLGDAKAASGAGL